MSNQDKKILELKSLVEGAELSLQQARKILDNLSSEEGADLAGEAKRVGSFSATTDGQVIEGLFDGQNMLGPDGKRYSVPANYASKSKLVEGDGLKLTIMPDGSFVYKQINLLDRDRLVGVLAIDEKTDEYRVVAEGKSFKVLTASITYYKGEPGDRVTILVPKDKETTWAAVENVFKAGDEIPGVSEELKTDKTPTAEAPKSVFDEVKLPEETMPAPELPKVDENTAVANQDQFLSEGQSDNLYGPSAPGPKTSGEFDNFLRPEPAPTDGLEDKDNQGLEEI
ncbi:MAG TPA: hypothetical protein PLR18_03605 [bacterium]|nr:hypothetical protein [bacterium]